MRVRDIKFWQGRIELENTEDFPAERKKLPQSPKEKQNYEIAEYLVTNSQQKMDNSQLKSAA